MTKLRDILGLALARFCYAESTPGMWTVVSLASQSTTVYVGAPVTGDACKYSDFQTLISGQSLLGTWYKKLFIAPGTEDAQISV